MIPFQRKSIVIPFLVLSGVFVVIHGSQATVIVQDTFEGTGCSRSTFWRQDDRPTHYCSGSYVAGTNCATSPGSARCSCLVDSDCTGGRTCFDDPDAQGPEIGTRNGIPTPSGGGSCYVYKHYHGDESSTYLNSSDELNQSLGTGPYNSSSSSNWPAGTKSTHTWHSVEYLYFDSQHSGVNEPTGTAGALYHPIHQKLGKWILSDTWTAADASCSNPENVINLAHVRGATGGDTTVPMSWMSFMEASGTKAGGCAQGTPGYANDEPPNPWNLDFGNGINLTWDTWHKVETYVNLRGTCTGGATSNTGCSDQMRVWVDGVLAVTADTGNFAGGTTGANLRGLSKFWFLGNASASGGPVNYWLYLDSVCVGTSYSDCTGAPYNATMAQAEFGGVPADTQAPTNPTNLQTSVSVSSLFEHIAIWIAGVVSNVLHFFTGKG